MLPGMHRRRSPHLVTIRAITITTSLLTASLLTGVLAVATETSITLNRGANITVTAPGAPGRMAFDLAGQIWLRDGDDKPATPLTKPGAFNQRPAFSRDGRHVAHESSLLGFRQIFVTNIDSGVTRQVTFGPFDHIAPAWSPMNSPQDRLVISSNRGGTFDIWEVDIDNLDLHQLTFMSGDEHDPAWNDEGTRLAYVATSAHSSSLYILTPGEKPQRVLHEREHLSAPAWRPGGGLLTYTRQKGLASQLRMLLLSVPPVTKPITQNEQVSPRPAHWLDRTSFVYAADGKIRHRVLGLPTFDDIPFSVSIAIKRDARAARNASPAGHENRSVRGFAGRTERADGRMIIAALSDLWEFQRDGNDKLQLVRQLTNDAFVDAQPTFSPDGEHLAFVSDRSGSLQVWIMDHASRDMRRLTRTNAVIGSPVWQPDGAAVAYVVAADDGYRLQLANIASRRSQALAATARHRGRPVFADGTWTIGADRGVRHNVLANEALQTMPLNWRPATAGQRYIVRAGRIFDGIGPDYIARQEIVIERDRIIAIRPWSGTNPGTPIIDATAHTVIPGLIDLATYQEPVDDERNGRKWLAAGVTTIRQTVTDFDRAIERLESWSSGRRIGPRLMLTVRPCHNDSDRFDARLFEHMLANAAALNIVAVELCTDLTGKVLADTIRQAHEHGLSVIATTPVPGIAPGADEMRPANLLSNGEPLANLDIWRDFLLLSTMTTASLPSRLIAPPASDERVFAGLNTSWQYRQIFTAAERRRFDATSQRGRVMAPLADPNQFLGAGGSILLGSEAPFQPQGLGLHTEMRQLSAGGIQPFQILKMASLDAAHILGNGESQGLIRVGRKADLVILDGDPLANIDAAVNVVGTIVNGRYTSRKELTTPGLRGLSGPIVGNFYNSVRP